MSRAVLVYVLLVLAPSAALAVFAYRVADWDHRVRIEEAESRVREEADALGRRVEASLADATRRAEEDGVAGYARDGRWIGYSPDAPQEVNAQAPSADDLKHYRLSMRGGESFELVLKDAERALDAYSFYVPRIHSPALRARLQLGAGRSAMAAGNAALGAELLRKLFDEAEGTATEEGLPIDLLAAGRLLEMSSRDAVNLRGAAGARLRKSESTLSTPLLARFASGIAPDDEALRKVIEQRRNLERAVAAHPEILATTNAVLMGRELIFARPHSASLREIRLATVALPPLDAGELTARIGSPVSPENAAPGSITRQIRLGPDGPVVATLRVEDPRLAEKMAAAVQHRNLQRALVGILVLVTLAGGGALAAYLSRERRLARLRSRLLANVSHELKTPVTSIRMFSELLAEDGADPEKVRRFGRLLTAESSRLSQLVENLLDFSRLGKKEESLALEPVDVAALLRRVADGFEVRAREMKAAFRLEGVPETSVNEAGIIVETHAAAVERIILNLLDNALKYRRDETPEIRLALAAGTDAVRVSVSDNGIGIPRREHERVFEELYRVRYDDYAVKGSGLGLSIARRLARKLGGDIAVESQENVGSTFTLMLPANASTNAVEHDARSNPDR